MNKVPGPKPASWLPPQNRANLLFAILLPGFILADLIYGSLSLAGYHLWVSPGQLTRGVVLAISVILLLTNRSLILTRLGITLLTLTALVVVSTALSPLFPANIRFDIGAALRVLYGPYTVVFFITLLRHYRTSFQDLMLYLECIFYFIGIALFLMSLFEIGEATYGSYAFGFIGVFKAQNDTGLTATIALCAALYGFINNFRLVRIPLLFIAMMGLTGIGTRTAMSSTLVVSLVIAGVYLVGALARFQGGKQFAQLTARLGLALMLAGVTSLYAYGVATGNHILPFPKSAFDSEQQPTEYQLMKMERTFRGEAHRKDWLDRAAMHTSTRDTVYDWLGEGAWSYRAGVTKQWPDTYETEPERLRYAEMDWFDFYGQFGALFAALLYLFYFSFLSFSMLRFFTTWHPAYGTSALILGVYIAHSLIAGHAMNSPMVSTQIAAVIAFLYLLGSGIKLPLDNPIEPGWRERMNAQNTAGTDPV